MTHETEHHSRRELLLLLGIAAAAPLAVGVTRAGEPARGVVADVAVAVLSVGRRSHAPGQVGHDDGGHDDGEHQDGRDVAPSWSDVVQVALEARNVGATAVLLSPGQFRLQLPGALSVMPCAWQHGPGALQPGEVRRSWVEYRAPAATEPLRLEFSPAGSASPVVLGLSATTGPETHAVGHS